MRVLLAILVGLAQVAGPWLCCCGSARAATPVQTAPVDECPVCAKKRTPPADTPKVPEPCPCGGKAVEPAPRAKPEPVAAALPDLPAVSVPADAPVVALPLPPVGVSDLPFLPPGTRQFVHHVLRC